MFYIRSHLNSQNRPILTMINLLLTCQRFYEEGFVIRYLLCLQCKKNFTRRKQNPVYQSIDLSKVNLPNKSQVAHKGGVR